MFRYLKIILTLTVTMLFWGTITNVKSENLTIAKNGKYAHLDGEITPNSAVAFQKFLDHNPKLLGISLNSPGGTVVAALEIAELISSKRLGTFIAKNHMCASACSILFFAGYDRLALGRLGVHQMDDGGRGSAETLQYVLAHLLDAFQKFEIPWAVSRAMLETPAREMFWIPPSLYETLSLNRDLPGDASQLFSEPPRSDIGLSFASFPPTNILRGRVQMPDFGGRDREYRTYRTRIRNGANAGPNFAGHFALIQVGCGTSCDFAFVVDLLNGEVFGFPYGGEEYYEMGLFFTVDSKLLKVRWAATDLDFCIEQDLLLMGHEFQVLNERRFTRDGFCDG